MKKLRKPGRTRIAAVAAAVLAAGVVASLAATGYAARIVAFSHTSPTAAQYPSSKVTICHHTHSAKNPFVTITVSVHALPAHMKHGDTVGPCPQTPAGAPVAPVKQHKLHKAHKANHGANKSDLRAHGKAAKTHVKSNRGHHQQNTVQGNAPTTVHGKSHAHVKANSPTKSHGPGNGKAKGHTKTHTKTNGQGNAHNQTHGQGHGHGQGGQGQGQGPGTGGVVTHGNGKGNGHKP